MFSPANVKTTTVSHAQTTFHSRKMLDALWKKFLFHTVAQPDELPRQSGLTVQWFRYNVMAENTVAATEGTVGTPIDTGSATVSATLSQYKDFMTFSDVAVDTLIDRVVSNGADNLGYRFGLSLDIITRNVVDAINGTTNMTAVGANMSANDIAKAIKTMQASDAMPFENDRWKMFISPFVTYDVQTDSSAMGLGDIYKHTNPQAASLRTGQDRGTVATVHNAEVVESTNVKALTGPVKYRSYIFGRGGLGRVSLAGRGPNFVIDPKRSRMNVRVFRNDGRQIADPEGVIAAAAAYNALYAAVILDTVEPRIRTFDHVSSISS